MGIVASCLVNRKHESWLSSEQSLTLGICASVEVDFNYSIKRGYLNQILFIKLMEGLSCNLLN